jgi:hypothetical protein
MVPCGPTADWRVSVCLHSICMNKSRCPKSKYVFIYSSSLSSSSVYHNPLMDIGLSKCSPSALILDFFCQLYCANRHSTWPEGFLHFVYRDAVSTQERVYRNSCGFYGRYSQPTATSVSWYGMLCRWLSFRIRSRGEIPSIAIFIARWVTLNLWTNRAVRVHVLASYVITVRRRDVGSTMKDST